MYFVKDGYFSFVASGLGSGVTLVITVVLFLRYENQSVSQTNKQTKS